MTNKDFVLRLSRPDHTKLFVQSWPWDCWGLCWEIDVGPPLFTLLQPELPTNGVRIGCCDQPLKFRSHQTFHLALAMKLLGITLRDRCRPTTLHTVTTKDAHGCCQEVAGMISPSDLLRSHLQKNNLRYHVAIPTVVRIVCIHFKLGRGSSMTWISNLYAMRYIYCFKCRSQNLPCD